MLGWTPFAHRCRSRRGCSLSECPVNPKSNSSLIERIRIFEVRLEIEDPVEVEEDLLMVENVTYLRGRDGIEVQARSAWLIRFRDGEQTSLTLYQTKPEALEAAGLR